MALPWTPRPREILQSWIDAIKDEASDSLTDWENDFMDNIENQLDAHGQLSERQEAVLERIYAEKTK